MASYEEKEITVLRGNDEIDRFRNQFPDGYVILDGDRGIGLVGEFAKRARNMGPDPEGWIDFANKIGPLIHQSYQ